MSKLLSISAIRDYYCSKQCCNKNCMVNLCKMPKDCLIDDINFSEPSSDLTFFTKLVAEARSQIPLRASSKERLKYLMKLFANKHHDAGNVCYQSWRYQICTTLCAPLTVCRHAFCSVYGVDSGTIDTCQRLIRQGRSEESRDNTIDDSSVVDAMKYFGLELNDLPAVNQHLDKCPETAASLTLVAYLENEFYFLGDQEVFHDLNFLFESIMLSLKLILLFIFNFSPIAKKFI